MAESVKLQNIADIRAVAAVSNLSASGKASDAGESAMSFGNVLTKASEKSDSLKAGSPGKEADTLKDQNGIAKEKREDKGSIDRTGKTEVKASKKDPKENTVSGEDAKAVREAAETVKGKISEELGVSEEEVEAAMETLGLTLMDLLKPENIGALTAEIKGTDILEVVADEAIYGGVQSIMDVQREVTGDLIQDLNMTPEEFRNALDAGVFNAEPDNVTDDVIPEDTLPEEKEVTEFRNILQGTERGTEIASKEETAGTPAETVKTSEVMREPDRQPERKVEVIIEKTSDDAEPEIEMPLEKEKSGNRDFRGSAGGQESFTGNGESIFRTQDAGQNFMENVTEAVSQTTSEFLSSYERVQNILNQVKDQIRITVNQETTTMEMQLNPESLGKVGLHIESKAGNITAQFLAQDESVRAALETQVADLRKSLEDQGIKVESVEVTLASREFESNFMNGQQGNNGDTPTEEETERASRLRRINLGAAAQNDIPEEEMSEEERLNRRIMRENGSSVDFTA